jgi:6-phosphogluconolactonase (cycloisomerase 2 family)
VANHLSNNLSAFSINETIGDLMLIGTTTATSTASGPNSVVADITGQFVYVTNLFSSNLSIFTVDPLTGGLVASSTIPTGTLPRAGVSDPKGTYLFLSDTESSGPGTLSVFRIDRTTQTVVVPLGTPIATGTNPVSIAVDTSGKFIYIANYDSNNISVFSINYGTGVLMPVETVTAGTHPNSIAITTGSL